MNSIPEYNFRTVCHSLVSGLPAFFPSSLFQRISLSHSTFCNFFSSDCNPLLYRQDEEMHDGSSPFSIYYYYCQAFLEWLVGGTPKQQHYSRVAVTAGGPLILRFLLAFTVIFNFFIPSFFYLVKNLNLVSLICLILLYFYFLSILNVFKIYL